jgi:type IV secretion system protein VirB8
MKKTAREALDAYYRDGDSWANDRQDALRTSRRIAWIVAIVAVVVALCEALALLALLPLKTVVPYTLLVDKQTGYVQALKPLEPNQVAPDAALTQSFLVQYVIARESFDIDALQASYRKVALWSGETARSDYVAATQVSSPDSPLRRYPRSTIVETRVKSVSPLGGHAALVRFETQRRDAGGQLAAPRAYVAVIRYRFSGEPMSTEDRYVNPLGFQVLRYRRDAETLASPEPAATSVPAPATATGSQPGMIAPGAPAPLRPRPTPSPTNSNGIIITL